MTEVRSEQVLTAEAANQAQYKGVLAGRQWLPRDVSKLCYNAGWKEPVNLMLFVATVGGESDFYDEAVGDPHLDGTIDLGLFQLNSNHASELGLTEDEYKQMAFDPNRAVTFARKLWDNDKRNGGTGFGPWFAFSDEGYKRHLLGAIIGVANFLAVSQGYGADVRWTG